MHDTSKIASLIRKKIEGSIGPEEALILDNWAQMDSANLALLERLENKELLLDDMLIWLELLDEEQDGSWGQRLEQQTIAMVKSEMGTSFFSRKKKMYTLLPYVAALLIFLAFGFFYYRGKMFSNEFEVASDLKAGTNRAYLTLSDGRTLELDGGQEGIVSDKELRYADGSVISAMEGNTVLQAELTTPRGGQYKITLSDGTEVWLNSDSKLIYPASFADDVREVQLEGEAYFSVASCIDGGRKKTFIVRTARQKVEVMGTEFNVTAYAEDSGETTTLVEGAVKLYVGAETLLLKPGDQGVSNGSKLDKRKVDVEQSIAWRNGKFIFDETELREVMEMLSRWYDFEVYYEEGIPSTYFYGTIERKHGLSEVLKIMESSGLKFKIEKSEEKNRLKVLK